MLLIYPRLLSYFFYELIYFIKILVSHLWKSQLPCNSTVIVASVLAYLQLHLAGNLIVLKYFNVVCALST